MWYSLSLLFRPLEFRVDDFCPLVNSPRRFSDVSYNGCIVGKDADFFEVVIYPTEEHRPEEDMEKFVYYCADMIDGAGLLISVTFDQDVGRRVYIVPVRESLLC